jgi:hypothetical protein
VIVIADVMSKVKVFIFLSSISLLINLSIFGVSALSHDISLNTIDTSESDIDTTGNYSVGTIGNVAVAAGTSFIPFVDLINIATLDLSSIPLVLVFYSLITVILGALKVFIIATVILNLLPFLNV